MSEKTLFINAYLPLKSGKKHKLGFLMIKGETALDQKVIEAFASDPDGTLAKVTYDIRVVGADIGEDDLA